MTQAYIFTGAAGSGRREVMADLVSWSSQGTGKGDTFVVLLPMGENSAASELFNGLAQVMEWDGTGAEAAIPDLPQGTDTVFILLNGKTNPVDQFERLTFWMRKHPDVELARIITVLNSRFLFDNPGLKLWFDACIHFSDVVLFNNREGVTNKWFSDFKQRFAKECYPCQFEFVKGKHVNNPAEVLFPETRRMSLAFDYLDEDLPQAESSEEELDYEIVDETEDEDGVVIEEDEDEVEKPEPERFFELDAAGRRRIRLPDIATYLK